jgi:hypothetical protein
MKLNSWLTRIWPEDGKVGLRLASAAALGRPRISEPQRVAASADADFSAIITSHKPLCSRARLLRILPIAGMPHMELPGSKAAI